MMGVLGRMPGRAPSHHRLPLGRRKRSYKQAVSELDEEQQLEDEELQPPRSKTPSPPCPASKVSALCLPSAPLSCPPGPDPGLSVLPPGVWPWPVCPAPGA